MRARKGSGAERLGIKFTGNPDPIETVVLENGDIVRIGRNSEVIGRKMKAILTNPGKYLIDSLS